MIPESDYIFWGTGRIAKGFYKKYCKERGILRKPLLWCDNNPSLQGSNLDGVPVVSSEEVAKLSEEYYQGSRPLAIVIGATGINYAFEPDGESYRLLQKKYRQRENVILHGEALWHCQERMGFSSGFLPSASRISEEMNSSEDEAQGIQCVPLVSRLVHIYNK